METTQEARESLNPLFIRAVFLTDHDAAIAAIERIKESQSLVHQGGVSNRMATER